MDALKCFVTNEAVISPTYLTFTLFLDFQKHFILFHIAISIANNVATIMSIIIREMISLAYGGNSKTSRKGKISRGLVDNKLTPWWLNSC